MGTTHYSSTRTGQRMTAALRTNLQVAARQADSIGRAVGELAGLSREVRAVPLKELLGAVGLAGLPMPSLARARACRLPECHCPPSDLGNVRRVVDRPERVDIAVRLRNSSSRARTFEVQAGALVSHGGDVGGAAGVSPAAVTLDPGEVAVVKITVDASKHRAGVDYDGVVRIRAKGCEDMTLGVTVHVATAVESAPLVDLHCCCRPNVRPLRWYHHYYCDPPASRVPDTSEPPPDQPPRPPTRKPVG